MYCLVVYIPKDSAEVVKEALFAAGAGQIGNYKKCAFTSEGKGQFMPCEGSSPSVGSQGLLEVVDEVRLEVMCAQDIIEPALHALLKSHPYETPAYYIVKSQRQV